jgi:hypothetical protein
MLLSKSFDPYLACFFAGGSATAHEFAFEDFKVTLLTYQRHFAMNGAFVFQANLLINE